MESDGGGGRLLEGGDEGSVEGKSDDTVGGGVAGGAANGYDGRVTECDEPGWGE